MRAVYFLLFPLICAAQMHTEEEALALRRIADFWQEGEYQIAKSQIEEYLKQFPQSSYSDTLCAALGDLFLREKNYSNALSCYSQIVSKEWLDQVFLNRLQALYHLEWYATLADECESYLGRQDTEDSKLQVTYYLAISLYQQCLNASKNPEQLEKLALRAQPYFVTLFQSDLSNEVSQAFAHLCCILKDYAKASDIYLDLAQHDESGKEDFLFQAAMLQTEFDKEKASRTFEEIANLGQHRAQDAAFNRLVLSFELGKYDDLAASKEELFRQIPEDKIPHARLFLGRSYLALKKYPEATQELKSFIDTNPPYEMLRAALVQLLDAAQQTNDLFSFDAAMAKLSPEDPERPKAIFSRAILLKKERRIEEAKQDLNTLLSSYPQFPQSAQAAFELTHLEYQTKSWSACRATAIGFIQRFPSHELLSFAWRYLASSSAQLASQEPAGEVMLKKQLASDLENLLQQQNLLADAERNDWQFLLAKTYYELNQKERSLSILMPLSELAFSQDANTKLLIALIHKEKSPELFCQYAEEALQFKADLIDPAQTHIALFNTYLDRSKDEPQFLDKAANHLFASFSLKGTLQQENHLWLSDYFFTRAQEDSSAAQKAFELLKKSEPSEDTIYKLAKLYDWQSRTDEAIALLEGNKSILNLDARLLLAESYVRVGKTKQASEQFDSIVASSPLFKNQASASACLQGIQLKRSLGIAAPEAAAALKTLILQRSLTNEPIHLEAALEYIDLQAQKDLDKRLSLLAKTKADFQSTADLLSKDYQESRHKLPQKEKIYQSYMTFFDADAYLCQANLKEDISQRKELQAKAKDLLLQIIADPIPAPLKARVREKLQLLNCDESGS
ncbi:MAG: outer membrane protein assembly factor BamD [Verrucomicrobia bacterium]|nr:outer membrane protein assembly factor BamD [Verrucomicrobiota bacterium]